MVKDLSVDHVTVKDHLHQETDKLIPNKEVIVHKKVKTDTKQVSNRNRIITSLVAGAIAGAVAKTVIAPLDRTKINFQISATDRYTFRAAVHFLLSSYYNEGFFSLWRGNSATMIRIMPYSAVQFMAHEQWKRFLHPANSKDVPPLQRYVAGSLAGVTATTVTYPLDMARARMAVTQKEMYYSLLSVFRKMYKTEGLFAMYRGYSPTLLGEIPYAGTSFFTYETLKKAHTDRNGEDTITVGHRMLYGACAGLLGQSASYPLDIARRRMQTAGITGTTHIYTSVWTTLYHVATTEGIKNGLYKGLSMNWIKGPIAIGISFTVFDITQSQLRKLSGYYYQS